MENENTLSRLSRAPERARLLVAALGLALLALLPYLRVFGFDFVALDDPVYVLDNAQLKRGLDLELVLWAFRSTYDGNWFPLTWISHALDVSLYGYAAGGHHATSVALHLVSTLALFAALRALSGCFARSLVVAALFAVHPLHVESVAWISERKDVLSSAFGFGALWCYAHYVRARSARWYAALIATFAASLMAKPMWVTLPFLLLLLDVWPLRRVAWPGVDRESSSSPLEFARRLASLAVEKAPLFALALVSSVVTYQVQQAEGAMTTALGVAWPARGSNALASLARYLRRVVWPSDLSPYYPHPFIASEGGVGLSVAEIGLSLLALAGLIVLAWRLRRAYFWIGGLWFVGMLVPVIGLAQVGGQGMADRYVYAPLAGALLAIVWGVGEWLDKRPLPPSRGVALAAGAVLALLLASWQQVEHWRNARSVYERALAIDPRTQTMRFGLARIDRAEGRVESALEHYRVALEIDPHSARAHNAIGLSYKQLGRLDDARVYLERALELQPGLSLALNNLATVHIEQGELELGEARLREALAVRPRYPVAELNLAELLEEQGRRDEAEMHYRRVSDQKPNSVRAHRRLAALLEAEGRAREALESYRAALAAEPGDVRLAEQVRRLESALAPGSS